MKCKLLIISFFLNFLVNTNAQNIIHLCIDQDHDFSIPSTFGSVYEWNVDNPLLAAISSGNGSEHITLDLNAIGMFQLKVKEININGCIGYDSILIQIHEKPIPIISAQGPLELCEGDEVAIIINKIYEVNQWSDGTYNSDLIVDETGDYFVFVTDEFGCSNKSNTIHIEVDYDLSANFLYSGTCVNDHTKFISVSSSISPIYYYRWDLGNGVSAYDDSVSFFFNNTGSYDIKLFIENNLGCQDSIIKTISVFDNPVADFTYNPLSISTLSPEVSFTNHSTSSSSFFWSFGDSSYADIENPNHIYENPGTYDIVLVINDLNNCQDSISKSIIMRYDFVFHVPSAFTPNDDGDNDFFGPKGLRMDSYKSYDLYIYNNWGELIFETSDINEFWDGVDAPSDVYNWLIVITDELGRLRKENGLVTLIR